MKNGLLISVLLISACAIRSQHSNYTRSFQFKYEVALEPTYGEKLELWNPNIYPRETEISFLNYKARSETKPLSNQVVH